MVPYDCTNDKAINNKVEQNEVLGKQGFYYVIMFLKPRAGHVNLLCIDQVLVTTLTQWGFEVFLFLFYLLNATEKNSKVSNMDLKGFKVMTDLIGMCQIKFIAVVVAYLLIVRLLCLPRDLLAHYVLEPSAHQWLLFLLSLLCALLHCYTAYHLTLLCLGTF